MISCARWMMGSLDPMPFMSATELRMGASGLRSSWPIAARKRVWLRLSARDSTSCLRRASFSR
jgi:hypothetical protein